MTEIRQGCCLDVLPTLPEKSVQCCVTSPPYWALRDYGTEGQLGLEKTPEEYVANMVEVFRQVKRVLRDDGTLWLNLGDSYAGNWGAQSRGQENNYRNSTISGNQIKAAPITTHTGSVKDTPNLKPKDLVGIPWLVAFALRADGWYLRSDIIWHKPNPMPGSQQDRPTTSHEYLFLLSKSQRYFYDQEAIREPASSPVGTGVGWNNTRERSPRDRRNGDDRHCDHERDCKQRTKRSVWTIPTQPYSAAHFATFPEKLVEPSILAGTSEEGCCAACGAPYERVTEKETIRRERPADRTERHEQGEGVNACGNTVAGVDVKTVGWQRTCDCPCEGEYPQPCTVLDPFMGSGTVGQVAKQYGRKFIGIELNPEYIQLAEKRINVEEQRLFV